MSQTWLLCPSGPSFSSHCKVFHHNNSSYNHCLGFICLTWLCSLLSHAALCFVLIYSGEVKPQFFFVLAFLSLSILFYLCVILSWSACHCIFLEGFCL